MITDKAVVITICEYYSPCGTLTLGAYDNKLCLCDWHFRDHHLKSMQRIQKAINAKFVSGSNPTIDKAVDQLDEYFSLTRREFSVPLWHLGTEFQLSVWHALSSVPYGTTSTYRAIADMIDRPTALRAVANANGSNAIAIFTPCHRIIGSDNRLTGYSGGIEAKNLLLKLEQQG